MKVYLKILDIVARPHVPEVGHVITGPGHKGVEVGPGRQVYGHHVRDVAVESLEDCPRLHVPQCGSGVPGSRQDLVVRPGEQAAGGVACVSPHHFLPALGVVLHGEREHGQLVVQTTAGHSGAAGRVGAAHDPGGGQGEGVLLVGGEGVPHQQLPVLGAGHKVPLV